MLSTRIKSQMGEKSLTPPEDRIQEKFGDPKKSCDDS